VLDHHAAKEIGRGPDLDAVPAPRVLISTPVHLRALLASGVVLPPMDLILCSTAPLAQQLAAETEQRFATRLLEIYGSTETGPSAVRRPTRTPELTLWPGVTLPFNAGETWALGAHTVQPTRTTDTLDLTGRRCSLPLRRPRGRSGLRTAIGVRRSTTRGTSIAGSFRRRRLRTPARSPPSRRTRSS